MEGGTVWPSNKHNFIAAIHNVCAPIVQNNHVITQYFAYDEADRFLSPRIVNELQKSLDILFSPSECCDNGQVCPAPLCKAHACSLRYLSNFPAGSTVWLCPPSRKLLHYITHYLKCKKASPHTMSMCILVPDFPAMPDYAECTALLRHMCVIREFPAGTQIFARATANGGHELMSGVPCPVRIYYDPPVLPPPPPLLHCAANLLCGACISHGGADHKISANKRPLTEVSDDDDLSAEQPPLMLMPLSCNGLPGVALADTVALHIYISSAFAHSTKAVLKPCPHMTVRLADSDTTVPIEGMCKIKLTLHRKHTIWVTAFVLPNLVHGVSLILGRILACTVQGRSGLW